MEIINLPTFFNVEYRHHLGVLNSIIYEFNILFCEMVSSTMEHRMTSLYFPMIVPLSNGIFIEGIRCGYRTRQSPVLVIFLFLGNNLNPTHESELYSKFYGGCNEKKTYKILEMNQKYRCEMVHLKLPQKNDSLWDCPIVLEFLGLCILYMILWPIRL